MTDQHHNFPRREPLRYYPDTDTLYVELRDAPIDYGADAGRDRVIYYNEDDGLACAHEIEHASQHSRRINEAIRLLRANYARD